jgi:hypothetical protein
MPVATALLALAALLAASPGREPPPGPDLPARLDAGLASRPAGAERALWASGLLRGAPYALSPLGEGSGPDPDPTFRLDRFDCTTLVETALALGRSGSVAEARAAMDRIRYGGPPALQDRNHYVESQWLPALVAAGWLEDATARVGGDAVVTLTVRHTRADWEEAARRGRLVPGLDPAAMPDGVSHLPVVPLDRVRAVAGRIPDGAVVLVARTVRPGFPSVVVHMGMVATGAGGKRIVRHASGDAGRVVDEPLERFVSRYERQRRWPVAGLAFLAVRPPS